MLAAAQRARFARHLLLTEIGEAGQVRLCETRVGPPAEDSDPAAAHVCADYLGRAGVQVDAVDAASTLTVASPERIDALAGSPALRDAASALAGAFAAVEHVKRITGAGTPGSLPSDLRLAGDAQGDG